MPKPKTEELPLPILVKCGRHYINPEQVSTIREVRDGKFYVVEMIGNPNPEYPIFVSHNDIGPLMECFEMLGD